MPRDLKITLGQYSDKGRKSTNQDFHGALIPEQPLLGLKGIAIVLADGISSSDVSAIAAESAVKSFLTDYFCTPDSWTVKTSAQRVISATNSWLYAQTRRSQHAHEQDKGYVCTLCALVLKSTHAHFFHVGDSRIYRVGAALEQLTDDHRVIVSSRQSYLGRALGAAPYVEIDYRMLQVEAGEVYLLASDGAYEYASARFVVKAIASNADNLDAAARAIVEEAIDKGSPDNLTVQIVRIDELPEPQAGDLFGQITVLPPPPLLEARAEFEGYTIERPIHSSARSHIYLATDNADRSQVAIKIPSLDMRGDPALLKRFMTEEWIGRRINSAHVVKPRETIRKRNYQYVVTEFIDGQTLSQWMIDHPAPELEVVRGIVEQIASGLQAFHRKEMLHLDLRPDNIMIDASGTVKIVDFGSTRIAGVAEAAGPDVSEDIAGTLQYTAPEMFLGERASSRSDLFSLGVIACQMLTGRLPYGDKAARARTKTLQNRLRYHSVLDDNRAIPAWVDAALRKAVQPDPWKRHGELSEFLFDLRHPNESLMDARAPLLERNPALFWKWVSAGLVCVIVAMLAGRR